MVKALIYNNMYKSMYICITLRKVSEGKYHEKDVINLPDIWKRETKSCKANGIKNAKLYTKVVRGLPNLLRTLMT